MGYSLRVVQLDYFFYLRLVHKKRELYFYKDYFREFYDSLSWKVQKKILWTLEIVETLDRIPEIFFKHLENTEGLYEIRFKWVATFTASSAFLTRTTLW